MKKTKFHIILILLVVLSCKNDRKTEIDKPELNQIEITDNLRLELLTQVLSDSILYEKLRFKKSDLISNKPKMVPPNLPIDYKNPSKTISHKEFIADTLSIENFNFVESQFQENKAFDLMELSNFGYEVFDLHLYESKEIKRDSISKLVKEHYKSKGQNPYREVLHITKPIFNEKLNLSYIRIRQGTGGMTLICEKKNKRWSVKYIIDEWIG